MPKIPIIALVLALTVAPVVAQNSGIAAVTPGIVTQYAGYAATKGCAGVVTPTPATPYDGCPVGSIQLEGVALIAFDVAGNLYIADNNDHRIRKITPAGVVSTFAGTGAFNNTVGVAGTAIGDGGLATSAVINLSSAMTVDSFGNLYVADYKFNRVRVVYEGGAVLANLIGLENPGTTAQVGYIYTIAGNGTFPTTVAPTLTDSGLGDGGPASSALFGNSGNVQSSNGLGGVAVDSAGNVYIDDSTNDIVRVVSASTGVISLYAGVLGSTATFVNGSVAATSPIGLCRGLGLNAAGDLFIVGASIFMVNGPNTTSTVAGLGFGYGPGIIHNVAGGGSNSFAGPYNQLATLTKFSSPRQITLDAAGDIYNNDNGYIRITKTDLNDTLTLVAGNAAQYTGQTAVIPPVGIGGPANALQGGGLAQAAINPINGNLYVADADGGSAAGSTTYSSIFIVSASSGALGFGNQSSYVSSPPQLAIVSNVSSGTLHLSSIAFSATTPFAQVPSGKTDCSSNTVLAPGTSCYVAVQFTPTAVGAATGTLTVTDDSGGVAGSTQTFALSGTGTTTASSTALSISPSPASAGSSVTFTAKVAPASGSPTTFPTGTVSFLNGTTTLGTGTLNAAGIATFSTSTLAAASYTTLTASYPGDSVYLTSTSANASLTVASTPATSTALSVSSQTIVPGASETLTATVSAASGTPTGSVQFYNGAAALGTPVTLTGGIASYTTTSLPAGYNTISAVYTGSSTTSTSATIGISVGANSAPVASLIPGIVSLFAGSSGTPGSTGDGGAASAALLSGPTRAAFDASGNLYLADTANQTIRKIAATSGAISASSTLSVLAGAEGVAGAAVGNATTATRFQSPQGIAFDPSGNLYVADSLNNVVKKVAASGGVISSSSTVSSFAGSQVGLASDTGGAFTAGYSGDGGAALSATLNQPRDIAIDRLGDVFIADYGNNVVRMVNATGATTPGLGFGYAAGVIHTVAGSGRFTSSLYPGGDGGAATSATFSQIGGIAVDLNGNLYISDTGNFVVRKVTASTGVITTYAGTVGTSGYQGDGAAATSARLLGPAGLSLDVAGNLYIADAANSAVRLVNPAGIIYTVAGTGVSGATGNGGPSTSAQFYSPVQAVPDGLGNLYILDSTADTLRQVNGKSSALNFPEEIVNTTSAPLSAMVSNVGGQTLTLSGLAISSSVFTQTAASTCASSSSLAPGANCTVTITAGSATGATNIGTLTFTDNSLNATGSQQVANLSIVTAAVNNQTIAWPQQGPYAYGVAPVALTATATSGLPITYTVVSGPATVNNATATLTITGAGSIVIQAAQPGKQFAYYAAPNVTQTIVVGKAALTFTASSFSQAQGITIGPLNYTAAGFVNGDTQVSATAGQPTLSTTATSSSPQGTYPISISSGTLAAANYTFTFVNGTLTLAGAPQTITMAATASAAYSATAYNPGATSSSGLAVVYTILASSSPNIAKVNGTTIALLGAGTVTIQASQPGNYNATTNPSGYGAALVVTQVLTITPASLTVTAANFSRPYAQANPAAFTGTVVGAIGGDTFNATYTTSATTFSPAGTYAINGTVTSSNASLSNYAITYVPGTLTITQDTPVVTLSASTTTVTPAAPEVLTATVSYLVTGAATPSGTVSFYAGTVLLQPAVALNAGGIAKLSTFLVPGGIQNITAVYSGDVDYVTVTSSPIGPIDVQTKSAVTVTASSASANLGDTVTFTAAIAPSGVANNQTATGTVTFTLTTITTGSTGTTSTVTTLGTSNVNAAGVAIFTTNALPLSPIPAYPAGKSVNVSTVATPPATPYQINATYAGDAFFQTSATATYAPETITPQFDIFILSASPTSGTVAGSNEGTYTSTGSTTTFASLGSVTITSGQVAQIQGTLEANNQYVQPVTLSCTGLPQYASCAFSQSIMTPTAFGAQFNINLSTAAVASASARCESPFAPGKGGIVLSAALLGMGWMLRRKSALRPLRSRGGLLLLVFGTLLAALGASGCGSGTKTSLVDAPTGTTVVTVTGTTATSTFNSTFTLIVQ